MDNEKFSNLKLPIWSGDFLSKIDLSEVSFDNVAWSMIVPRNFDGLFELDGIPRIKMGDSFRPHINYSNTNAVIDFKKSWEFKNTGKILIGFCNFSGTDLSNNDFEGIRFVSIFDSWLDNTKLQLHLTETPIARNSSLDGTDLSKIHISLNAVYDLFRNCTFKDTGLNIDGKEKDLEEIIENYSRPLFDREAIIHSLRGCYIHGKKVESIEKYKSKVDEIISNLASEIEGQTAKK